ncbi:MAG: hypothetical protein RLZZ299_2252 [Pseudomonadota bacterium]|jgi:hypothetical protein
MHSESFLYNATLVPLAIFGTTSVCLAFVLLLPGVGQALVAIWGAVTADWFWQRRQEKIAAETSEG